MPARLPTSLEIAEIADDLGLHLETEQVTLYRDLAGGMLGGVVEAIDSLPDGLPPVRYPRTPGSRPEPGEDPLNAWYVRTRIEGAPDGRLSGKTIALKDNVMLAGVPLMNGTATLEGYVPPVDATIVERMLDAGGTILGKAVCEAYCFSGGSHTSATGPVHNPHRPGYSAGGSSSGSAALVAAGEVDLAIGCDQGGSIRMPSSFCGTYGMKPTHGLVPYTGILGIEPTIDHAGPITGNVADNALLLEVIAGPDGLDSRQIGAEPQPYTQALGQSLRGLRIGMLREGFGLPSSEPDVDAKVRAAGGRFAELGANVSEISVAIHSMASAISFTMIQSAMNVMLHQDGCPTGREDLLVPSFLDFHRAWRTRADDLPETIKVTVLATEFLRRNHGYRYYAKGVNQMRRLRAAYDAALGEVDLLLMPTTPMKATPLPPPDAPPDQVLAAAFAPLPNTQPFDHTHHPAMSIPCGTSNGLPVGVMLVGRHHEEATIYRAAHAFEKHADWREL